MSHVLIVGAGPSAEPGAIYPLSHEAQTVIGINNGCWEPWATDGIISDRFTPEELARGAPACLLHLNERTARSLAPALGIEGAWQAVRFDTWRPMPYEHPTGAPENYVPPLPLTPSPELYFTINSLQPAFHFALKLRPDRITLIGFEFGKVEGFKVHQYDPAPKPGWYAAIRKLAPLMYAQARALGVEVVDRSLPGSTII